MLSAIRKEKCYCCEGKVEDGKYIRLDVATEKLMICSLECFKEYLKFREIEKEAKKPKEAA